MGETLDQGLLLMALGMGTVFGFLGLLVGAVSLMSRLLATAPAVEATEAGGADPARPAVSQSVESDDPELISAIIAAVHRYRGDKR
ncbi:MAG: OadG family protein [Pseudomonadota bacterium]